MTVPTQPTPTRHMPPYERWSNRDARMHLTTGKSQDLRNPNWLEGVSLAQLGNFVHECCRHMATLACLDSDPTCWDEHINQGRFASSRRTSHLQPPDKIGPPQKITSKKKRKLLHQQSTPPIQIIALLAKTQKDGSKVPNARVWNIPKSRLAGSCTWAGVLGTRECPCLGFWDPRNESQRDGCMYIH